MIQAAIIIPHRDDVHRLGRCLAALVAQKDLPLVEIVVVDSGATYTSGRFHAAFPEARFVTEPKPGAAAARNKGVAETTAANLFFLDSDCIPAQTWLETALASVEKNKIIGGRVELFDEACGESGRSRTGAQSFETLFGFNQSAYIEKHRFSVTANLLTTRQLFAKTGGFRDGTSEDKDWCRRAIKAGAALNFAPNLVVQHPTRNDWQALWQKWARLTREEYASVVTPKARLGWIIKAALMPLSVAAHLPRILLSQDISRVEKPSAALTLCRLRLRRMGEMLRLTLKSN